MRRQCFRAFSSVYCKCASLSETAVRHLVDSFCEPVFMYNLPATNISKSEISRIEHAWKSIMYRIYGVTTDGALNMVYAHTNCLPICTEMLLRQCSFLTDCSNSLNKIVRFIFTCFGCVELSKCVGNLGIADVYMPHMSSKALRALVFDRFLC